MWMWMLKNVVVHVDADVHVDEDVERCAYGCLCMWKLKDGDV